MWSNNNTNYPSYYIPAPMLCNSGYSFQLPDYLVPVFLDPEYDNPYYRTTNYNIVLDPRYQQQQIPCYYRINYSPLPPPWLRLPIAPDYAPYPHPGYQPYPPHQVGPRREKRIRRNTPRFGFQDWNVQVPLQISKVGNRRCQSTAPLRKRKTAICQGSQTKTPPRKRKTARCQGSQTKTPPRKRKTARCQGSQTTPPSRKRKTTRCQGSQTRKKKRGCELKPLQVSNLPKRKWIRNPSDFRDSGFEKRKRSHAPCVASTRSSLRVSTYQKRSHKFKKRFPLRVSNQLRFPLRVSNQWRKRSQRSYVCFKCKKQGHLAIRCPQKMMRNKSSLSSSVSVFIGQDGLEYSPPSLICQCGLRCSLTTRKTREKTSRECYTCSLRSCKIFRWEDEVNEDELISVPKCRCGAGFCRQYTESDRKYFACPIKKGQGACTFFKLPNDSSLINNRHVDERITPLNLTIGDCTDAFPANNVQKENQSLYVLDTAEHYPNQREISGNQKLELMEVELECEEDTSNKTLRKCNKRFRDGAPKYDSSFSNTVVEFINVPQSYSGGGDTEGVVHARKSTFQRQIPNEENSLAGVFPSFDPISVPRILESQNRQNPRENLEGSLMFGAISDQFFSVAIDLQNKLISLLKSSDFRAHDYMDREANITFTALDRLQVQSKPFCERVKNFIRSASNLDKAEGFVNDQSYNDSQDHYNSKKRKRDELISDYDVAKADMESYKKRLKTPSEETSGRRTMLFQVEAKVSSSEAQNKYHEARCAQISLDLLEAEKNLEVAEKDLQLLQQKREEYNAANVAYKKARLELGIVT